MGKGLAYIGAGVLAMIDRVLTSGEIPRFGTVVVGNLVPISCVSFILGVLAVIVRI